METTKNNVRVMSIVTAVAISTMVFISSMFMSTLYAPKASATVIPKISGNNPPSVPDPKVGAALIYFMCQC